MKRIINTNIRFDLSREDDRQAYESLRCMDRTNFKSYTRAVVAALNDFFSRQEKMQADPFLETREKEDRFLAKVLDTVKDGISQSMSNLQVTVLEQSVQAHPQPENTDIGGENFEIAEAFLKDMGLLPIGGRFTVTFWSGSKSPLFSGNLSDEWKEDFCQYRCDLLSLFQALQNEKRAVPSCQHDKQPTEVYEEQAMDHGSAHFYTGVPPVSPRALRGSLPAVSECGRQAGGEDASGVPTGIFPSLQGLRPLRRFAAIPN